MSYMKKGLRADQRKQIDRVRTASKKYLQNFNLYSEVAYKLSNLEEEITAENIEELLAKHSFEPLDEMGKFLVLGECGRIKQSWVK